MPMFSRVLRPASKRKPPIRKQRSGSACPTRIAPTIITSADHRSVHCRALHQDSRPSVLAAFLKPSTKCTGSSSAFADLYPVFRVILESRTSSTCTWHVEGHFTEPTLSRKQKGGIHAGYRTTALPKTLVFSREPNVAPASLRRSYSTKRHFSSPSTSRTFTDPPHSISQGATASRIRSQHVPATPWQPSACRPSIGVLSNSFRPCIPIRTISHQHNTGTLEDSLDPRTIGDNVFTKLSKEQPFQTNNSNTRLWFLSRILDARRLFQEQEYIKALETIQETKLHSDLHAMTNINLPAYASRTLQLCSKDLALLEYCCRLAILHTSNTVPASCSEAIGQWNESLLSLSANIKAESQSRFRTSFQPKDDPIISHTFAILSYNRGLLDNTSSQYPPAAALQPNSSFSTVILPFLRTLLDMGILPSHKGAPQSSGAVSLPMQDFGQISTDIFLSCGEPDLALRWICLWRKRDSGDWQRFWTESDFKERVTSHFLESGRPDLIVDLYRLVHQSAGTPRRWLRDVLTALEATPLSRDCVQGAPLSRILALSGLDSGMYATKKEFYKGSASRQYDLLSSWMDNLRDVRLSSDPSLSLMEQHLWREAMMVGILSKGINRQDVMLSLDPETALALDALLDKPTSASEPLSRTRSSPEYSDPLTLYLGNEADACCSIFPAIRDSPVVLRISEHESTEACHLLKAAIQEIMSRTQTGPTSGHHHATQLYKGLLHNVAHRAALRLGHLGLVSRIFEERFHSQHTGAIWGRTTEASLQYTLAHASGQKPGLRRPDLAKIPQVREFVAGPLRSELAKMCARSVLPQSFSGIHWKGGLSDWFMAMAESSSLTGPMARCLNARGRLEQSSKAYEHAMWVLLQDQELDLAVSLHSWAYGLKRTGPEQADYTFPRPPKKELGELVRALANSSQNPAHLTQAQWIVDQHLDRVHKAAATLPPETEAGVDIQLMTELTGGWSRRAEFDKVRHVVEAMQEHGIKPNMIFYNTLLKALVDLAPISKPGRRAMGSGKQEGMRELGRKIMVRQLIMSQEAPYDGNVDGRLAQTGRSRRVKSVLDDGWELFHELVSCSSDAGPVRSPFSEWESDSSSVLGSVLFPSKTKSTFSQGSSAEGTFRPDAFTFSILLDAFGRRGEIEAISELFVEMSRYGLEPDLVVRNILANAFAKRGDTKSLDRIVQETEGYKPELGLHLSNIVLDSLVELEAPPAKIHDTLRGMIATTEDTMSLETENASSSFSSQPENGSSSHIPESGQRQRHLENGGSTAEAAGLGLDAVSLTTLIKYHTQKNDLRSALDVLQAMVRSGFVPGEPAYVLVLSTCLRRRDVMTGLSVIRTMRSQSTLLPDAKAWKGLLRCALELEKNQKGHRMTSGGHGSDELLKESVSVAMADESDEPVASVLAELSRVVEELDWARAGGVGSETHTEASRYRAVDGVVLSRVSGGGYLYEILTSSWLSVTDQATKEVSSAAHGERFIKNPKLKGQNGLLRRLLDHLLRGAAATIAGNSSLLDTSQIRTARESRQEVERRCGQAIWLVQFVESTGIELGTPWKWQVVGRKVLALTEWPQDSIRDQLGGRRTRRKTRKTGVRLDGENDEAILMK